MRIRRQKDALPPEQEVIATFEATRPASGWTDVANEHDVGILRLIRKMVDVFPGDALLTIELVVPGARVFFPAGLVDRDRAIKALAKIVGVQNVRTK